MFIPLRFEYFVRSGTNRVHSSLEKQAPHRASPWRMLEHPWMVEMRSKRVNMAHFLSTVWGWEEAPEAAAEA